MTSRLLLALFLFATSGIGAASAQKPFTEGTIIYKVKLNSPENKRITGVYTFTFKGSQVRKELKLENGYQDVLLLNSNAGTAYSLQNRNNKKYAIELSMPELRKRQEHFANYSISGEELSRDKVAGYTTHKGNIRYKDGSGCAIVYTKEWSPPNPVTFERFPDARFMPVIFSYQDENGMHMEFEAEQIAPGPIENAIFRIPPDYKMISHAEYMDMSR